MPHPSTSSPAPATDRAFDPRQPFTRGQALRAGLTDRDLTRGAYRRLLHGIYVASAVPETPLLRARAALLCHHRSAVATHVTAARMLRAPVPDLPHEHVTVADEDLRRRRRGVRCHVASVAAEEIRVMDGVRFSCPERMFVELARLLGLVDLVAVGDFLVRRRHTTCTALVDFCARSRDVHAREARRAAAYVRDRVDSPMETRLRMLIVLAGLPEPEVNVTIRDEGGTILMRVDLCYPRARLAIEYDGQHHVEIEGQQDRDDERQDDLDELDERWRVLTVTSKGVYRRPDKTVDRVWRALRKRGYPQLRRPTDAWRPHFR